jgi:hypothetical protein
MFGRQHWTPAQGTIVATHAVKTTGDGMVTIYEYVVDVRTAEGEVFRAKVDEPRIAMNFLAPSVGAVVKVEFDPASHNVRFDKDDPALSTKSLKSAQADAFDQALTGQPAPADPATDDKPA